MLVSMEQNDFIDKCDSKKYELRTISLNSVLDIYIDL